MKFTNRPYQNETDYTRIRAFLRKVHLLNNRIEKSWPVARLDYWRWHVALNCQEIHDISPLIHLWEDEQGELVAVLTPEGDNDVHIQIDPRYQSMALETEMITLAEEKQSLRSKSGNEKLFVWVDDPNPIRTEILTLRGYQAHTSIEHQHYRDLTQPLPPTPQTPGYIIRSLGGIEELPSRSWASWRAFHPNSPDEEYEGWEWYLNIQRCPLYRRDLDIIAEAPDGSVAAFCTLWYDDVTQTGYFEPVGTVPEHQQRGLGKTMMIEAMRRLKNMNGLVAMVGGYSPAANALYGSVVSPDEYLMIPWVKEL
ncbi:MAG: GNAT family N-acetyltransferase [Anaerolineaceae bacterium]|nr:GNAT family N-acetyltransferase [Anaerolineaceae bacterium]